MPSGKLIGLDDVTESAIDEANIQPVQDELQVNLSKNYIINIIINLLISVNINKVLLNLFFTDFVFYSFVLSSFPSTSKSHK